MIRITTSSNPQAAISYHKSSLQRQGEYYQENIPAYYHGKVARQMGLYEVTTDNYGDLAHNRKTTTKDQLTPINAANRRVGWDITVLPPKSFSIMTALTNDPELEKALLEANQEMMLEVERLVLAQNNTQKTRFFEKTANGIWASFHHTIGRPVEHTYKGKKVLTGQPLQHVHNLLFSVTYSPKRQKFLAIDPYLIFKSAPYLQAYFHTQLTNKLVKLGYAIERTPDAWEIKDVSRELIERFSERTKTIEKISQEKNITSAKAKAQLGAKTRLSKSKSVPEKELLEVWKTLLSSEELKALQQLKNNDTNKVRKPLTLEKAINRSLEHFLERQSVAEEKRVLAHAMQLCFGSGYHPKDFEAELNRRSNILKATENEVSLITTQEMVRHENALIDKAVSLKGKFPALHADYIPKRDFLNSDQKNAVKEILTTHDGVIALEGKAGAGKTTMLQELSDGLKAVNKKMVVIAPSSKAVDVLRKEGFQSANTIASFLIQPQLQESVRHQVLCVDEASLSGVPTLSKLLDIVQQKKARLVLSGNIRQHNSPGEFGDGLRILQQQAQIKTVHLQQNMRQREVPEYKEAVDFIARGKTLQGFQVLDQKMKAVVEIPEQDKRMEFLAEQYIESLNAKRTALIVSPTNAEKEQISEIVREKLKAQGTLQGKSKVFEQLKNVSFTESQKKDPSNYQSGQYIRFIRNTKGGFKAGQHYEVMPSKAATQKGQKETEITVKDLQTGQILSLPYQNPKPYSVFQKSAIALNKGDLVKPTLNLKSVEGTKINNGTAQKIKGFSKSGDILLENGKTLAKDCYHIAHNYVSTSHGAQGATVKDVYISMSEASLGAVNQQTLYVAVSRGKSKVQLVTDNKKALKMAVARTGERKTAREIEKQHHRDFITRQQREQHKALTREPKTYAKTIQRQPTLTKGFSQRTRH